ncbi:glycosyltransferase family 2 protein [Dactylosporangium sp. NPDC000244]|uniref:glycosyltransferase n=1 Tax=Dactylosporangium sp. NPDC000244 TaxID=3154365 RepID=UPI0033198811
MSVSVVIPSTLERKVVGECVAAALDSAARLGPDAEVLLVANRVPPGVTYEGPASPALRVLHSDPPGVSRARNTGVAAARHDTVLFVDDDLIVPESWCADMHQALKAGPVAVSGPVRLAVLGPITAFMDHQRFYDASPLDGHSGGLLVTANAGYRRDMAPPGAPFDVEQHPNAGEDTDLALRLRAAGGRIGWLDSWATPLHYVDEDVSALAGRALRDGRSCARLHFRYGLEARAQFLPSPWRVYSAALAGRPDWYRQFAELDSVPVRGAFATMAFIYSTCLHAGYLQETGQLLGHPLLEVDAEPLLAELDGLIAAAIPDGPAWSALAARLTPEPRPDIAHLVPLAAIAAAFQRHAPRTGVPPRHVLQYLNRSEGAWVAELLASAERTTALWQRLERRSDLTLETVEREGREAGLSLSQTCGYLDRFVAGRPLMPSAQPRARQARDNGRGIRRTESRSATASWGPGNA